MSSSPLHGTYRATVANNNDPTFSAGVTLHIPQILGTAESAWATPSSPTKTVPAPGSEVWVSFSGGDVRKPVYTSHGLLELSDKVDQIGSTPSLDAMPPKQPTGLALTTALTYTDEGNASASVKALWTAPTENQDSTPLTDLRGFEGMWSYDQEVWSSVFFVEDTTFLWTGIQPGRAVYVQVWAVDKAGNQSLRADDVITSASSSTPPARPSIPVAMGALGGIRVTWNGLDETGAVYPPSTDRLNVERAVAVDFSNKVVVAAFSAAGAYYDSGVGYTQSYNYRLVAVSKTGVESVPSGYANATASQAVEQDILEGAITQAKVAVGAIDTDRLADDAITAQKLADGAVEAGKIAADAVGSTEIRDRSIAAAQIALDSIDDTLLKDGAVTEAKLDAGWVSGNADAISSAAEAASTAGATADSALEKATTNATAISDNAESLSSAQTRLGTAETNITSAFGRIDSNDTAIAAVPGQIDTAKSEAISTAAEDATVKSDLVNARAVSRGTDLVTNGTGLLGNNYNFSGFIFDPTDTPVGGGSFYSPNQSFAKFTDELIPIDLTRRYLLSFQARQRVAGKSGAHMYGGLVPIASDGDNISPVNYMYQAGTTTTLAAPLNPGDTVAQLTSAANWNNGGAVSQDYLRSFIFWNYEDAQGKVWPTETFSRLYYRGAYNIGGISGNTVTLSTPWAGPAYPAGAPLSNGSSGGSYMYGVANQTVPETWTQFTSLRFGGSMLDGVQVPNAGRSNASTVFPPGTSFVKVMFLGNRDVAGSEHGFAAISFTDTTAAAQDATQALSDAEAKSAAAQQAAIDAAAEDATTKANNAEAAAVETATTMTNNVNRSYSASSAPTTDNTAAQGSIWRQMDTSGRIIGVWEQTGVGIAGTWTPRAITSEVIDNLDVGKLSATSAVINEAVVNKIAASTAAIQKADIGNLTVTGTSSLNSVVAEQIAADTGSFVKIDATNILADAVIAGKIAADAITAREIQAGTITAVSGIIGSAAILSANIKDAAVTNAKISDLAVTTAKIANLAVTDAQIGSLDAGKINTGYLSAARIDADTITGVKIAAGTITGRNILGGTITGDKIFGATITGDKIAAKTITANEMAVGTITAESGILADASITDANIANLSASKITAGTINAAVTVAGVFQTNGTGARSVMDSTGFHAFNANGVQTFDTTGGDLSIVGTFATGVAGARTVISGGMDGTTQVSLTEMFTGAATEGQPASLKAQSNADTQNDGLFLELNAPGKTYDLDPSLTYVRPSLRMFSGDSDSLPEVVILPTGKYDDGYVSINGGSADGTQAHVDIHGYISANSGALFGGNVQINNVLTYGDATGNSYIRSNRPLRLSFLGSNNADGTFEAFEVHSTNTKTNDLRNWSSGADLQVLAEGNLNLFGKSTSNLKLGHDNNGDFVASVSTYNRVKTGSANMLVDTYGVYARASSLERYKVNINREWGSTAPIDAIKALKPTSYYDRGNAESYAALCDTLPPGHLGPVPEALVNVELPSELLGLIAEDVDRLGLRTLATYDATGEINGVAYDRLAVHLLPWLHQIDARLERLEAAISGQGGLAG